MFLAIITMSMILKKQTNLFSNDYNSFQSNATPIQVVVYRTGNECLKVIVGTPAALGELKVLIAKLFEYEN